MVILERDAVGRSNHENDERRREGTRSACDQPEKENPLFAATSSVRISIRSLTDGVDKIPSVAMGVEGSKDKREIRGLEPLPLKLSAYGLDCIQGAELVAVRSAQKPLPKGIKPSEA